MSDTQKLLHHCLYFSANSLARIITRLAEDEFKRTGLSPSHAFLLMLANESPGIGPKQLSEHLHLAPSTVTRFIDALVFKGLLRRESEGKTIKIFATTEGRNLQEPIRAAWKRLHERYAAVLGLEAGDDLALRIDQANRMLEDR